MTKKDKIKRRPSGYNLHIKKCMGEYVDEMKGKPFGAAAPFMKKCTEVWKKMGETEKAALKANSEKCVLNSENKWECP